MPACCAAAARSCTRGSLPSSKPTFPRQSQHSPSSSRTISPSAGLSSRLSPYWQRAGERAVARSANLEAIAYLERGLEILRSLPDTAKRDEQELLLEAALIPPTFAAEGWGSSKGGKGLGAGVQPSRRTTIERPAQFYALFGGFGVLFRDAVTHAPRWSVAKDCLKVRRTPQ